MTKQPEPRFQEIVLQLWENQYEADGETVLSASCSLPRCSAPDGAAARRFDRFYRHFERCFQQRTARLAKHAAEAHCAAREASRWFTPWVCTLDASLEQTEETLSVHWQLEEQPGTSLSGDERWNLCTGFLLP